MKKKLICVYYADFILGGIESYYMRMFEWAHRKGIGCTLVIPKGDAISAEWRDAILEWEIEVVTINIFFKPCSMHTELGQPYYFEKNQSYTVIVTDIHSYLRILAVKSKLGLNNMKIIIYVFHIYNGIPSMNPTLNKPFKKVLRSLDKDELAFMDEETKEYYEMVNLLNAKKYSVLRLGMIIKPLDLDKMSTRMMSRSKEFMILTISRLDFPFKGYILNLIDVYAELKIRYPKVKLKLIGDGEGRSRVKEKIATLPANVSEGIEWIKRAPYEKLKEHFDSAHIYVGMGTTLLDASLGGVISIVSTAYQLDGKSTGYFYDDYRNVSGQLKDGAAVFKVGDLLEKCIRYSDDEYQMYSLKSYDSVKCEYNLEQIMQELLKEKQEVKASKRLSICVKCFAFLFSCHKYWKRKRMRGLRNERV